VNRGNIPGLVGAAHGSSFPRGWRFLFDGISQHTTGWVELFRPEPAKTRVLETVAQLHEPR